jgi:hypothetical protein
MYMRATRFHLKQDSISKFEEVTDEARRTTARFDGLQHCYSAIDESGNGLMVAVWDSEEQAAANLSAVKEAWAGLAQHFDGPPQMTGYSNALLVKG